MSSLVDIEDQENLICTHRNDEVCTCVREHSVPVDCIQTETMGYRKTVVLSCLNTLAHCFIGASVFIVLWFICTLENWSAFQIHILLCVVGYQLLMANGILSMHTFNGWSSNLRYCHKRRAHWILQLLGSLSATAGSVVMMREKAVNFTSIHGKLALASLIFTGISLLNGLTSLYSAELRRYLPAAVSKLSHLVLSLAAYVTAMVCLGYGYNKKSFVAWSSQDMAYIMMAMTAVSTFIVIMIPAWKTMSKIFFLVIRMRTR